MEWFTAHVMWRMLLINQWLEQHEQSTVANRQGWRNESVVIFLTRGVNRPWVHWACHLKAVKKVVWSRTVPRYGPYVSVETTHTSYDILWLLWNNLAAPHTDQSLAGGHKCTHLNREVWKVCACVREGLSGCLYGWISLSLCLCVCVCGCTCMHGIVYLDWSWSREYHSAEWETICCVLQRAAGQQLAMLMDHLFNVQTKSSTFMRCKNASSRRSDSTQGVTLHMYAVGGQKCTLFFLPHYRLTPASKESRN